MTYTEFVEGCLRIAGQAKGKDLLRVQYTLDKKFERVGIGGNRSGDRYWILCRLDGNYYDKKRIYWID